MTSNPPTAPPLPVPADDGAADHLRGVPVPDLTLLSTDSALVDIAELPPRSILYVYPLTAQPGVDLPPGWDEIPGARGCTTEACGFRDHHRDLLAAGAGAVFGLSSQSPTYQREVASRLHLTFPLLSDEALGLASVLGAPTFEVDGRKLYRRMTLILTEAHVEHVFYPVYPPDQHARQVLTWLLSHS